MRLTLILSLLLAVAAPSVYVIADTQVTRTIYIIEKPKPILKPKPKLVVVAPKSQKRPQKISKKVTKRPSKGPSYAQREAKRKALARRQVANARRIANERKRKEEESKRQLATITVTDRISPRPMIEVAHKKGDVLQISAPMKSQKDEFSEFEEFSEFSEFEEFNEADSF